MGHLRSCTVALALLMLAPGCAQKPYLHWQGGDAFGVFEGGGKAPSSIDCRGTTEQRFSCFSARVRERAGEA
ncbi:MAG TPA: hypothetical protein VFQ35_28640, partial [Polyangiaceae bacterium]|nr:hypothetical protein [Polyangiaceae bacterium]